MENYPTLKNAEWFVVFSRGKLAFRFGPFTGPEAGKILETADERKLDVTIIADCGTPFNWEMAKDLHGWTEEEYRADERRAIREALEKFGHHEAAELLRESEVACQAKSESSTSAPETPS